MEYGTDLGAFTRLEVSNCGTNDESCINSYSHDALVIARDACDRHPTMRIFRLINNLQLASRVTK